MEKKKLIIGGIIAVAVVAGIAVFMFIRQPEPPIPPVERQEPPIPPVEQQEPFVPDMTIEAEFCRDVITRAQLREITDYQGEFTFTAEEYDDPVLGLTKLCAISTEIVSIVIGITDLDFETMINRIRLEYPDMYAALKELDNVGEKAVIVEGWQVYIIFFSDGDINRLVVVNFMGAFTRENIINLAKQVEANIR